MGRLFGTDGIRGVANKDLSANLCLLVGRGLGKILTRNKNKRTRVLIGTDTRKSCDMIASSITSGLLSSGVDVINAGVLPTPAIAYLTVKYGMDSGIVISASHNPYEFNGIKIFGPLGYKLTDAEEDEIEALVKRGYEEGADENSPGALIEKVDAINDYVKYLLSLKNFNFCGIKAVIDCANGAAYKTARKLFDATGCECIYLNDAPDGKNINKDCGSTHLEVLIKKVLSEGADIGIAYDGDADRCLAVDERGEVVDGDYIMALLAYMLKEENRLTKNTVVGTVMTNLGLKKFCENNGIGFVSTKVGDRYVLTEMKESGYNLGGEQSGHVILSDYATTGDGELTSLMLIYYLVKSKKKLSELKRLMQKYPQYEMSITASEKQKELFLHSESIKRELDKIERNLSDTGRIVVRPSGTEPLIRIMTESYDIEKAKEVAKKIYDIIIREI